MNLFSKRKCSDDPDSVLAKPGAGMSRLLCAPLLLFAGAVCFLILQPNLCAADRHVFIGTQYLRPPNPRPEDWDRDLGRIQETGLSMIRIWVYWGRVNPRPGVWDFSECDKVLDLAEKHHLKVLAQLMVDVAPYWFELEHPETRFVDRDGHPVEFRSEGQSAIGGYPGPCFHNAAARQAGEEFMRKTASHFAARTNLVAYDVWNEVELVECWCQGSQAVYRQYLQTAYPSIDDLNRAYVRSYANFSEVRMPKTGVYLEMQDYAQFFHWVQTDYMKWRVDLLRPLVGSQKLVSHWIGLQPLRWRSDVWNLTDMLDGWGTSTYIGDIKNSLPRSALIETCWQFDGIRASARAKPWWLSEFTGGRVWNGLGDALRTDAELQLRVLLALGFGAEGALFWQWRPEIFGQESPNFGLTGIGGELTTRTTRIGRLARMISANQQLFDHLELKPSQIALMWEPRGSIYEYVTGEKRLLLENAMGLYRGLIDAGYSVDILNAREVATNGVPGRYQLLLAPYQVVDRAGLSRQLEKWVGQGGVLLAGPNYGVFNQETYVNEQSPPLEMADVFGARQKQNYFPTKADMKWRDGIIEHFLPGTNTVETYELTTAKALGFFKNKPAITQNHYGRGHAFLLGTYAGIPYEREDSPELALFLEYVCSVARVNPYAPATGGCIARLATSGGKNVVFLYNLGDSKVTTHVKGGGRRGLDLVTGESVSLRGVRMEPKGSRVIVLE
jgi:beta-galactosidase